MGLFDFLKPRSTVLTAPEPAATLDALLAQAAQDPAFQPEFYRRLLLEPLVVITAGDPAEVKTYVSDGSLLQVACWEDGKTPVFTSPARIFDQGVINIR